VKSKRITEYAHPLSSFTSQYGIVFFREWLAAEQGRFAGHGVNTKIEIKDGDGKETGKVALVRVEV